MKFESSLSYARWTLLLSTPLTFALPSYACPIFPIDIGVCISESPVLLAPTTVTAPIGTVQGQTSPDEPTVHEYLGIPFAYPPIGPRRFAPPQRLPVRPADADPINATKFGYGCPGVKLEVGDLWPYNRIWPILEGEDCLNLNIWTKPDKTNAPVLVWIFGGSLQFGSANVDLYNGANFVANNDVILVSINYRTNIFGFPNAPNLEEQNLGLLDQRVALEWIRDNIASFGGDPLRITLFGESAGGASVDAHAYAWPNDPIAHALISQSGTVGLIPSMATADSENQYTRWANLSEKVGCGSGTQAEQLKCMRTVPWQALLQGAESFLSCHEVLYTGFGPRVDERVIFSPEQYKRRGELGLFAKLPLLVGTNDRELMDTPPAPLREGCSPPPPPSDDWTFPVLLKIKSAVDFTCPARVAANRRLLHDVPVWRYRYFGSFNSGLRAAHFAETLALFGTATLNKTLSERDAAFIKYMQSLWTVFATSPWTGLASSPYNLPEYNPNDATLIRLDYNNELSASFASPWEWDLVCLFLGKD